MTEEKEVKTEITEEEGAVAFDQQMSKLADKVTESHTKLTSELAQSVGESISEGMKVALERRPEVIAAEYNVDSDRIRYDYWRNQTRPELDFVGSYGNAGLGGTTTIRDSAGNVVSRTVGGFSDAFQQVLDRKFKNWSLGLDVYVSFLTLVRGWSERTRNGV